MNYELPPLPPGFVLDEPQDPLPTDTPEVELEGKPHTVDVTIPLEQDTVVSTGVPDTSIP